MKRVPPSERTKEKIARVFSGESAEVDPRSELVRLAVQRVVEEALEELARRADHRPRTSPARTTPRPDP